MPPVKAAIAAAPPAQRGRLDRAIQALEADATPDGSKSRPPVVFYYRQVLGFVFEYYVADHNRHPQPIHIYSFRSV